MAEMYWHKHKNTTGLTTVHAYQTGKVPMVSACRRLKAPNGERVDPGDFPGIACGDCRVAASRAAKRGEK